MNIPLPLAFEKLLYEALPESEVAPLLDAIHWPGHTGVRLNLHKKATINQELVLQSIPWSKEVYLLKERPEFVADPAFHAGHYYVQEVSSSIVGYLVEQILPLCKSSALVLDLCAAPGGKSTHIASVLRSGDLLIANEVIQSRTPILHENLCKWGMGNHIITKADANELGKLKNKFDIVLADMPCSGEGMFRKDPDSIKEWRLENVNLCALRQQRIAAEIWPSIKPGGFLIYSTCTYNRKENEENILKFCKETGGHTLTFNFPSEWQIYEAEPNMYRMMPHRSPGEGFFFCVIQKPEILNEENLKRKHLKSIYQPYKNEVGLGNDYFIFNNEEQVYAIRTPLQSEFLELIATIPRIYAPGVPIGKNLEKRHETFFKPESTLALLTGYTLNTYPESQLNNDDIIKYLRRDSIANNERTKGIHLVTWNGIRAGFMNGANHIYNNLWPMEWRIRKEGVKAKTILNGTKKPG